ncbi:MAG: penicillin acylase family protein [Burkholderiaceae bacterium]|nr:penicillin acylase family protein [Burkholderiaceae bacterium]
MAVWQRRIGWTAAALGTLVLAGAGAAWVYVQRALPVQEGLLAVRGLPPTAPGVPADIRIERDAHGIPAIHAGTTQGAWFGLGFVHAQDRLWQMETHRRIGAGRLAEAFGPAALETDRFLRALGVRRAAAAQWERLQGEAREAVLAYTAGVNAYLADHLRARPPEFLLLGLHPEPWEPVDSLAWSIMMAWDLGGNWTSELLRLRLAGRMDQARIQELLPPYPGEAPLATADFPRLVREWRVAGLGGLEGTIDRLAAIAPESGVEGVGSNNWVVAGARSSTGKPLLANDPHLKLSTPALWYFARLHAPGLEVAGATLPGLPAVVLGQNRHIAWGYTNTGPDVQDLYLERLHPDDPDRYLAPGGGWARFQVREETIAVRGQAPVTLKVREGRHGPIISDAATAATEGLTGSGEGGAPRYAIAMRWTALDPDPGTLSTGLRFNRAKSVEEFIAASAAHVAPMQNMVVADAQGAQGHIGFVAPGRIPLRGPEHDLRGLLPAPGWEARYDWVGWLDPEATPRERNPERGWIATANQRVVPADYPHFLTSEWTAPWRQQRIEQLLTERDRHDLASLAAMQADVRSLAVQPLLATFRAARSRHPAAAGLAPLLAGFDGEMRADAAAPAVFHAWVRAFTARVLADELGPLWGSAFSERRSFRDALEGIVARQDAWWCDDKASPAAETCAMQADAALDEALEELSQRLGPQPAAWRWGELHQTRSEHRPFSQVAALARWFEVRVPTGGDAHSVNATRVNLNPGPARPLTYASEHGPSLRALYDLADPSRSQVIHSTGQSGLFFSPHYRDFAEDWAAVRYRPLWAPPGQTPRRLTLRPDSGAER